MEKPLLTVGIPMYRAAKIGWLSLESFARQQNPGVPWEVIILEDEDDDERLGEAGIEPYRAPLQQAGCARIVYEVMQGQPALSLKWKRAGELAAPSSQIFFLQGCDDYSDSKRLARTHRIFAEKTPDWTTTRFGLFYDIATGVMAMYDDSTKAAYAAPINGRARHATGLDMATRTEFVRQLPHEEIRRGVDHWFCCAVSDQLGRSLNIVWDETEPDWGVSLYTNGLNTISTLRWKQTFLPVVPFLPTEQTAADVLPAEVITRLELLASDAGRKIVGQLLEVLDAKEAKIKSCEERILTRNGKIAELKEKITELKGQVATLERRKTTHRARRWLDWLPG